MGIEKCVRRHVYKLCEQGVQQLPGKVRKYVQISRPGALELSFETRASDSKEDENGKALHQPRCATVLYGLRQATVFL